tara:strand:+ start:284 stop:691 length:408 start_codon:yes stop_codon:yes gene_type:complete
MVGMNDSGQRDRFLVDMKSGGVQVSMGTGYCGNNRKLGEVSYGRETWGSVSFSEHRIVGQQGERYPENKAQGAEFFGEIWIFLLHPFVDQPGLGLGLVTMAWDDCAMVTNPTTPQINTAGRAPGLGRCGACLILV